VGHVAAADGACASCQGAGQVRWARGHMVLAKSCPECGGAGRRVTLLCAVCAGEGRAVRSEPVAVRVPAGVSDGARLRIPGWGHGGRRGGAPGDLYVTVHVQPHPVFHRQGDDLLCVLPVAVHEAVLGGRIDAPTLDGRVKLRIPPGTQAGHRLRLAGGGLPTPHGAHGDLLYEIRLVLPEALDDRARELMREFGQLHGEDVRRDLFEQLDA
jgi:molecular chaperone DnaJ